MKYPSLWLWHCWYLPRVKTLETLKKVVMHTSLYLSTWKTATCVHCQVNARHFVLCYQLVPAVPHSATSGQILLLTLPQFTLHGRLGWSLLGVLVYIYSLLFSPFYWYLPVGLSLLTMHLSYTNVKELLIVLFQWCT